MLTSEDENVMGERKPLHGWTSNARIVGPPRQQKIAFTLVQSARIDADSRILTTRLRDNHASYGAECRPKSGKVSSSAVRLHPRHAPQPFVEEEVTFNTEAHEEFGMERAISVYRFSKWELP